MTATEEHIITYRPSPWALAILCLGLLMGTALMGQATTVDINGNPAGGYWNGSVATVTVDGTSFNNPATAFLYVDINGDPQDDEGWTPMSSATDGSGDVTFIVNPANVAAVNDFANGAILTFRIFDGANNISSAGLTIDITPPQVNNATSATGEGTKKIAANIAVTLVFSEVVNVIGTPQLTLETGTSDAVVDLSGGTGTTDLTFTYTVAPGHASSDLDYRNTTALALNGSTIRDDAGNNATLTLPAPGSGNSLSDNYDFFVDGVIPTVINVTASNSDGTYKVDAGQDILIQVAFSEAVTVSGSPTLQLETGDTDRFATFASGSGSATLNFTYTVVAGDSALDLNYKATNSLTTGTFIRDGAGNDANTTLFSPAHSSSLGGNKYIIIDTRDPSVVNVTSTTSDTDPYTIGAVITITVEFDENVIVTGTPTLALNSGGTASYTTGSGEPTLSFTYTVGSGENTITGQDLDYTGVGALTGTITDEASGAGAPGTGNTADLTLATPGAAGSLGANKDLVIDTTAPTVTDVDSPEPPGTKKIDTPITINVTFDESVEVTGTPPTLALNSGGTATYTSGTGSTVLAFSYTVAAEDTTDDLDYTSTSALNGTIKDLAGNDADRTLDILDPTGFLGDNEAIVIDGIVPTVDNVTSSTGDGAYKAGDIISIQVTFTQSVVVGGSPTLTLETGGADEVVSFFDGSGSTVLNFNYTILAGHTSSVLEYFSTSALALNGGTINDSSGNAATLTLAALGSGNSLGGSKALIIDTAKPTITNVTTTALNGAYKEFDVIPITITFSEVVNVPGAPVLTLETGTSDAVVAYTGGAPGTVLTFTYTVASGENASDLDYHSTNPLVASADIIDDAGNEVDLASMAAPGATGSLGANKNLLIDTVVPTVLSVTTPVANGHYKAGDVIPIKIAFSESVDVTGTPQLTLETGSSDAVVNYDSGSGSDTLVFTYTVGAGETASDLDYTAGGLSLSGGAIDDPAGNAADLTTLATPGDANSISGGKTLIIDTTQPTVTDVNSSTANGTYLKDDAIAITMTFDEIVTVTGIPKLTLETGTSDAVVNYTSGSPGTVLTFTYTVAAGDTSSDLDYASTTALDVPLGTAILDSAGNSADATLPTPGDPGSLGANKALVVDAAVPTVISVTSTVPDSAYKAGEVILIAVIFSEPVAVTGTPQLTLDLGSGVAIDFVSTSGDTAFFSYSVAAGHNTGDLAYTATNALNLNLGTIKDGAANDALRTLPVPNGAGSLSASKNIVIDTVTPTVLKVSSTIANGPYKAGANLPIIVVLSEVVTVAGGPPTLTLETGSVDVVVSMSGGTGTDTLVFAYTVQAGDSSNDLDYTATDALSLNGATITDPAGNIVDPTFNSPGTSGSLGADKDLVIDTTPPAALAVTSSLASGFYKAGATIPIAVAFTEAVTVVGTPTLSLNVGGGYAVSYVSGTGTDTLLFDYTVQTGHNSADLAYQATSPLALAGGTILDPAGNSAVLDLPTPGNTSSLSDSKDLVIDTDPPSGLVVVVSDGPAADIDSVVTNKTLSAHFSGFTETGSGIVLYEYAFGTTLGGTDVLTWAANGTDTLITVTDLNLAYKVLHYVSVRATDGAGNVSDTVSSDGVLPIDKPRLTVSVIQNSALVNYLQIFINDTLGMADSIRVVADSVGIAHTIVDSTTYVSHHKILEAGTLDLAVTGFSASGDTTLANSVTIALARAAQGWVATSADRRFRVEGQPGAVNEDRYLLVVDSTLFLPSENSGGAYRLGDGQFSFAAPVRVNMRPGPAGLAKGTAEQAIYSLGPDGRWKELPTVDNEDFVTAWASQTGVFRLGRRTIIVPQTTSLHQNYPNPFNPTTRIVFDLGFLDGPRQHATVEIYNLLGRRVITLFDGEASAGRYEMVWRGTDARGMHVASGVYFVRLVNQSGYHVTKKMLLVR